MNEEKIDVNGLDEDLVVLTTDDGVEHNFYHVATVDYKNEWYVFFQPAEEIPDIDDDEVVIFRLEEDENGEDLFVPIEDENLLNEVYEEYVRMAEEEDVEFIRLQFTDMFGTAKQRKIRTPAAAATANAIVREIDREGRFTVPF